MSDEVFQRYSAYYDLLYRDKDYTKEVDYVARLLRERGRRIRTILEFGSGTGKHGRLLAERGFDVVGIERSKAMVSTAKNASRLPRTDGGKFDCMVGDLQRTHVGRTFDAVISLFHVISYQIETEQVLLAFANAARHLEAGGIFLFDVWHGPAVLTERPTVRIKRIRDDQTEVIRIAEPVLNTDTDTVEVNYTVFVRTESEERFDALHECHRMRYFFPQEVRLLAGQTGLVVERTEQFLTGLIPSDHTWGVAYLLRKQ